MNQNSERRRFIGGLAGLAAVPFAAFRPARAQSQTDAVDAMLAEVTGGAPLQIGRVKLELPQLADNANSVSLKISVDSPMTATDYVKSIHIYAGKNPRPNIANFYLGARAGRAQVATRIRLAATQRVLAVATLSDGSSWSGTADVAITNAACYDGS